MRGRSDRGGCNGRVCQVCCVQREVGGGGIGTVGVGVGGERICASKCIVHVEEGGAVVIVGQRSMFFFSSRRRHTSFASDWSSDVCSSDLLGIGRA